MDAQSTRRTLTREDIDAIANRVRELLREDLMPARYVDAATLARHLSIEREWVYAHARELGAIRLGGPHGRLRFDLQHVARVLAADKDHSAPPRQRTATARRAARCHQPSKTRLLPYDRP